MKSRSISPIKITIQACWIVLGFICLGLSLSPVIDGDGAARYQDLLNIVHGEKPIDKFSSIQMVLALPLYYLGHTFHTPEVWVGYFNFIVFGFAAIALWLLLPQANRFTTIVLIMAASMLPHHIQYFYGELLSVTASMIGLLCLVKRKFLFAAILLGLGTAQTPATMPALGLVLLYLCIKERKILYGLFLLTPILITLGDNWFKYGTPLFSAYLQAGEHGAKTIMPYSGLPGFSYPLFFGLLSVLLSFGKGLSFFAPGLLFRWNLNDASKKDPDFIKTIDVLLVFLIGLILTYSRWWGWYGGQFWGPRYLLFASIPACFILAYTLAQPIKSRLRRIACIIGLAFSYWVCVQGYLYGNSDLAICGENKSELELLCWYVPEFSPLFRQFVVGFQNFQPSRLIYAGWSALSVLAVVWPILRKTGNYK
jgi:hypothetical protein